MKLKLLSSTIFLLCISLFLSLGFWQIERAGEKDSIVKLYKDRQLAPAKLLQTFNTRDIEKLHYRNFKIKGRYLNKIFLIDNKVKNKILGFNVVTPFQLEKSGEIIIVDRGWLPFNGIRDEITNNYNYLNHQEIDQNVQEINGYIYPKDASYTIGAISTNKEWPRLLQAINFREINNEILKKDLLVSGVIFRLGRNNEFGFNREWKIVYMDSNKHLGYAFQWFSLAVAFLIMTIIFFIRNKDE